MSEMLEKARNYETEKQVYVKKTTKPLFHVTAPTGWINDPNGFSVYDGKIHCSISTIHIRESGDQCIGDIV